MKYITPFVLGALVVGLLLYSFGPFLIATPAPRAGEVGAGQFSTEATSSTITVGPQQVITLFNANTYCASRKITTVAQPIMLSADANVPPTALSGILQAASTTATYTALNDGCGKVTAYGFTASTSITLVEYRW